MEIFIAKRSLAEQVAGKLQEQISLGKYQVNEKLPIEPELMKMFGVGRSTIREAIKVLANSGLVRVQQGAGTFVADAIAGKEPFEQRLKRANNTDLNEVRELIEMKIAEKAAQNRSDKDVEEISKHLRNRKEAAESGLMRECIEADISFHLAIAQASKNEILADLYRSVANHLKNWFLDFYVDTSAFKRTYHLHEELLNNIIKQDAKAAWNTAAEIVAPKSY
ncbi:FadR/GntR family transcriptional regulator [Mucilaginibacter auburnensis]|nr:FadR/GntR family transcriptional regulator [Mucilaginibacter auburnensis]